MRFTHIRPLVAVAFGLLATAASAQQLVVNGTFETNGGNGSSSLTGWTQLGAAVPITAANAARAATFGLAAPQAGTYEAYFGAQPRISHDTSMIVQTLTTVVGQSYSWSFWLSDSGGSGAPRAFEASLGTTDLLLLNNSVLPNAMTRYRGTYTATSTSTTLAFKSGDDSTTTHIGFGLDNVSVQAVPEPTTLAVLAIGSLAALRRRKRA